MTHILFITPYYPPETAAPAVRISETATRLVQRGYQVTVLTTVPNYPTGIVPAEYRGRLIQQEVRDGVKVIRVWSYASPNKGFLRRIIAQLSFGCLAPVFGGKAVGLPDIIIVESPPLFDAIAARLMAWFKRCPFIFLVSDLWPESAVQLGMLRNRLLIRAASWLEWSTYQKASLIWVVTEGIRQNLLQRGLPAERIFLLTNGVDTNKFQPLNKTQARGELGWDECFTILYAGTHGLAHGLETALDAAEQLKNHRDIRFVFVGDGAAKATLVEEAQKRELFNITFLDPQPHDHMPLVIAGADVCLVLLRKLPLFEGALPSKSYEVMACARPIILAVAGEARKLIEQEAGAAIAIEPESAEALVHSILYLYEHPEEAERLGQRGRTFVKARFDRDQLTATLETHLQKLSGETTPVTTIYENTSGKIPVEYIVDQWYTVMPPEYASSPLYVCWQKLLDLTFGLCGLIILALLLPFLALLIYLDSPGPIFYTQERTGYQGRTFSIYKFRSMHTEAEQVKRPAWVTKGDPRITRVGRFLRATHLDEMPQVLNILRGEMSLIGPRPERPAYVAELEKSNLFYRYRLSVKPGLTGWAQVKYGYGISDQDELIKLQYDLYYIKHRSLLLDLLIILKTVVEVGFGHGS